MVIIIDDWAQQTTLPHPSLFSLFLSLLLQYSKGIEPRTGVGLIDRSMRDGLLFLKIFSLPVESTGGEFIARGAPQTRRV